MTLKFDRKFFWYDIGSFWFYSNFSPSTWQNFVKSEKWKEINIVSLGYAMILSFWAFLYTINIFNFVLTWVVWGCFFFNFPIILDFKGIFSSAFTCWTWLSLEMSGPMTFCQWPFLLNLDRLGKSDLLCYKRNRKILNVFWNTIRFFKIFIDFYEL